MKQVSLKTFKEGLSKWAEEAHSGITVEVTRYNSPFFRLGPVTEAGLHVGRRAGRAELTKLLKRASKGRYLKVLAEDRDG